MPKRSCEEAGRLGVLLLGQVLLSGFLPGTLKPVPNEERSQMWTATPYTGTVGLYRPADIVNLTGLGPPYNASLTWNQMEQQLNGCF